MDIIHRISFNSRKEADFLDLLDQLRINYESINIPGGKSKLITFEIHETDSNWGKISESIHSTEALDRYETYFTNDEIINADWLRLIPTFEHGYPQPKATWIRDPINYEKICKKCGIHNQISGFRIKEGLDLKAYDFMSLYWSYALFCKQGVFEKLQANNIKGYEQKEVIIHEKNIPSKDIFQLFIPAITNPSLVQAANLRYDLCAGCKIKKYYSHLKGVMYLKRSAFNSNIDIIHSYEWFGGGSAAAYREILISNRFARLILANKWKGVRMKVVELVN